MKKNNLKKYLIILAFFGLITYLFLPSFDKDEMFSVAYKISNEYKASNKNYFIYIDYTQPITKDRLYILDLNRRSIILKSRVGHAIRSGLLRPLFDSNKIGSNKTCTGLFITRESFISSFGKSMFIEGLEKGKNNNCRKRAIIFHSNEKSFCDLWSNGCFVTHKEINEKIIHLTKNGTLIFVQT